MVGSMRRRRRVADAWARADGPIVAAAMDADVLIAMILAIKATVSIVRDIARIDEGPHIAFGAGDFAPGLQEFRRLKRSLKLPFAHDAPIAFIDPVGGNIADDFDPGIDGCGEIRIV